MILQIETARHCPIIEFNLIYLIYFSFIRLRCQILCLFFFVFNEKAVGPKSFHRSPPATFIHANKRRDPLNCLNK